VVTVAVNEDRSEIDPGAVARALPGGPFTIPGDPVRRRAAGINGFVTTRDSAYFFLPGIRASRYLGAMIPDGGDST